MSLQSFMEAELVRVAHGQLCICGFVRTQDGSNLLADQNGQLTLEPGVSVSRLGPSEEITFSTPPESRYFAPYVATQLRAIATSLNMPYELLAADVSMVTFASGRSLR